MRQSKTNDIIKKNDLSIDDLGAIASIFATLSPEGNMQLASPSMVNYYKGYSNRIIYLFDDIDSRTMEVVKNIILWNLEDEQKGIPVEERKKITLLISSYGRDLDCCFSLVDVMKQSKTIIQTVNLGVAASAARMILLNGTKGYRYCTPMSWALLHQGSGQSGIGTYSQLESQQANYRKLINMLKDNILENTKIDAKEWKKIETKENYFYSKDQLEKGIVDKVLTDFTSILI